MTMTVSDTSLHSVPESDSARTLDVANENGVVLEIQRKIATVPGQSPSTNTSEFEYWQSYARHGSESPIDLQQMTIPNVRERFGQLFPLTSTNFRRSNTCETGSTWYLCCSNVDQSELIVAQLGQIKLYASKGELRKAMVAVYDTVCAQLADNRFDDCDRLLESLTNTHLPADVALSFFMATASAPRALLPSRVASYEAIVARITSEGNAEVLEALKMCK